MRLPKDHDEAISLIRHAIDRGMRYIDTSRGYGESEIKLGKALKDGYREKVILSTKWSPWITKIDESDDGSADCTLRRIEDCMKRLDVDYLDFFQVWNIFDKHGWETATKKNGMVCGIQEAKRRGLIGHTGFTSHAPVNDLVEYLERAEWCEILLVSYNVLSTGYAPALRKAKELGIGTVVMNPVGGGRLAENSDIFRPLLQRVGAASLADLSIRYILSNPDVDTIISGIRRTEDVDMSIASLQSPGFSKEQIEEIEYFVEGLARENVRFCTACGYCMPCPQEVNIPKVMAAIYNQRFLGFSQDARNKYNLIEKNDWNPGANAEACTQCGACSVKCTQKLDIPSEMRFARRTWNPSSA